MTPFEISPCADVDEFVDALGAINHYGSWPLDREDAERFLRVLDLERVHAAREDGRIVGGAGAFTFDLSIPGGSAPAAGVTIVGVYPTHRRRGALRAMMRTQLDDVRRRGEPLAALWSSEEPIYGRYGYGMASLQGEMSLPRERTAFARTAEPAGAVRLVAAAEARKPFDVVWEAVRRERTGMFGRTEAWWETRRLADLPEWRGGAGPKRFAVVDVDGRPEAYGIYRLRPAWEAGVPAGKLEVLEALGSTVRATARIWRYLLEIDWVATITAGLLPVDHPLFFLLAEPRRMRFRAGDGLWLRVVDVPAALAARAYAAGGELLLEVRDAFCPWNDGVWRLAGGEATPSQAPAHLRLDVSALGSVYLGGFTWRQLADAGRVEELRAGGVELADAMFRTERAPWCPEIF